MRLENLLHEVSRPAKQPRDTSQHASEANCGNVQRVTQKHLASPKHNAAADINIYPPAKLGSVADVRTLHCWKRSYRDTLRMQVVAQGLGAVCTALHGFYHAQWSR